MQVIDIIKEQNSKDVLPKDTSITKYFRFRGIVFSSTILPDDRYLLQISSNEEYNVKRINPLTIVKIYDNEISHNTLRKHLNIFLDKYHKNSYGQEKIYD